MINEEENSEGILIPLFDLEFANEGHLIIKGENTEICFFIFIFIYIYLFLTKS